jgi:hypothetical protein
MGGVAICSESMSVCMHLRSEDVKEILKDVKRITGTST